MKIAKAVSFAGIAAFGLAACGVGVDEIATERLDLKVRVAGGGKKTLLPPPSPSAVATTAAQVSFCSAATAVSSFPIMSTYDVYVETEFASITDGSHVQTTRFYEPSGTLWQESTVSFSTTATCMLNGKWQTWDSMPVAGTAIQNYGLSGTWRVAIHLDGAATAMASQTFTLY